MQKRKEKPLRREKLPAEKLNRLPMEIRRRGKYVTQREAEPMTEGRGKLSLFTPGGKIATDI